MKWFIIASVVLVGFYTLYQEFSTKNVELLKNW